MHLQRLMRKIFRYRHDYGYWISIKQVMLYLIRPFYENVALILLSIDVNSIPEKELINDNVAYRLGNMDDASLITSIERMEEWLNERTMKRLSKHALCMLALMDQKLSGFYLANLGECDIPLIGLRLIKGLDEAFAEQITISKEYRRKGIATGLKNAIYAEFRKRGIKTVYAATRIYNKALLKFTSMYGAPKAILFRYIKVMGYRRLIYEKIDIEGRVRKKEDYGVRNQKVLTNGIRSHSCTQINGNRYYFVVKTEDLFH